MTATMNEQAFETEICDHLRSTGWLHTTSSAGDADGRFAYDRHRAIIPDDVIAWLEATQPEQLEKIIKPGATASAQAKAREQLLDRLAKTLDAPLVPTGKIPTNGIRENGGTLAVLRKGFRHGTAKFTMMRAKPETAKNQKLVDEYAANRVRVMQQVTYSVFNKNRLDLVLFVNGLPVATLELKTDFTQNVKDAISQYKTTRLPKDPATGQPEPLFSYGQRALVHFAVSNDEVWMTTKLDGPSTRFLPFNRGDQGRAGNPPADDGVSSPTSYLWQEVLGRDMWLAILSRFMHLSVEQKVDRKTGEEYQTSKLLFPRYHQLQAVTRITADALEHGPGRRYLIQHSAGSGKTNTIAWSTHRLATMHDADGAKVFDTVVVVTDRTVLDQQLQEAIAQIEPTQGIVATIGDKEASKNGYSSKSAYLAHALDSGKLIIVVTLQTFPFVLKQLQNRAELMNRSFAVIADEAHSSQTGQAAHKLKEVLSAEELTDFEDGGEVSTDDVLAAQMKAWVGSSNISFLAFTATPKAKTLELFGTPFQDADGTIKPRSFHLYTMQQAIEEEYILDVLRNYTTYSTAFQLYQKVQGGEMKPVPTTDADGNTVMVDESEATKGLMRWVKLHPTNISQKVQIIVEHFRVNIAHLLDGRAKAMVVTDSRKAAVRWKLAIDEYIKTQGYTDVAALVAFSDKVTDDNGGQLPEQEFSEASMNAQLGGQDLRTAFVGDEYRVMIVANKFQTGFDEPLLSAMYVDRKLSGVTAVQTLSRLNRAYPGKNLTFVLDFANTEEEILESFQPFYTEATLSSTTDPNLIHDLQAKLDSQGWYEESHIEAVAEALVFKRGNNAVDAALQPVKRQIVQAYADAARSGDTTRLEELDTFRKDLRTYANLFDFLSQILDFEDTDIAKRALFYRALWERTKPHERSEALDLASIDLIDAISRPRNDPQDIELSADDVRELHPITAAGSGQTRDAKMVALAEVVERLNEIFGTDFPEDVLQNFVAAQINSMSQDEKLVAQAMNNTEAQFMGSPDLKNSVLDAAISNATSQSQMNDQLFGDDRVQQNVVSLLGRALFRFLRADAA